MNVKLSDVIFTSKDSESFIKYADVYIKGNSLKYFQLNDNVVDKAIDEVLLFYNS